MNEPEDSEVDSLDWDLEERDEFMAAHEGDEAEPPGEVVVEVDE
jgi:hypothetical protein